LVNLVKVARRSRIRRTADALVDPHARRVRKIPASTAISFRAGFTG
jgi:hypothetical protein